MKGITNKIYRKNYKYKQMINKIEKFLINRKKIQTRHVLQITRDIFEDKISGKRCYGRPRNMFVATLIKDINSELNTYIA